VPATLSVTDAAVLIVSQSAGARSSPALTDAPVLSPRERPNATLSSRVRARPQELAITAGARAAAAQDPPADVVDVLMGTYTFRAPLQGLNGTAHARSPSRPPCVRHSACHHGC
jgi:hypothetical protein